MIKRLSILLIAVMLIPAFVTAQDQTYMRPDGKFYKSSKVPTSYEVTKMKHPRILNTKTLPAGPLANVNGLLDTLGYPMPSPGSNFGLNGQDILMQWFKAPADLTIKGFAYYSTEQMGGVLSEGKIVSINLTEDQLLSAPVHQYGYYEATGNGYNDITGYLDNADRTGGWTSIVSGEPEPFGADIWSDGGFGFPTTPDNTLNDYQWINTNILFEPTVNQGDLFAITFNSTYTDMNVRSLGFFAGAGVGYPGWKYYANGRLNIGVDIGWWVREYTWDFLVAVDITGDTPPDFNSITQIGSGLDLGPYTVDANITDENPGNPSGAGVASASLFWSIDGGSTWTEVVMTGSEPNFSAVIPAQVPGTTVEYYLEATDVAAQTSVSSTTSFYVYAPTPGVNTLVVFNGFTSPTGYPTGYYFGSGDWPNSYTRLAFDHDVWAYGPLVPALLNNYTNVLEICSNGPNDINNAEIKAWLDASANNNYMLAGDEWLGSQSGWTNGPHAAGDFIFDVLGVNYEYNDVNYAASGDQNLPSVVYPQTGSALGGPTFDLYTQVSADSNWTAPMTYDPYYEIGVSNWLDGVDFESDVVVDMKGLAIDGTTVYNIGGHRTLTAGNKIAFFAYDPLSLSSDTQNGVEYFWYGFMDSAPQVEVLKWFGVTVDVVKENDMTPESYKLSQNFPNPFNPSTTINFAIPTAARVVLKVYDVLGREVATLLDGEKGAGNYQVNFDASKLASGLYLYTINAGSFTSTKKMMLMK